MRLFKLHAFCLLTVLSGWLAPLQAAPVAGTAWPAPLLAAAKQAGLAPDGVSLLVMPVQGGPARLAINADSMRSVASVMKLFTTGVALQTLGPAYTWKTDVGLGGPLSAQGTLDGPLYVKGRGDPALVLERVQLMVARIRAAGLHDIHGDLIVDRQQFSLPNHDPAAFDGQTLKPYNAGPDALLLNHRALILRFRPDAAKPHQVKISMEPNLAGMRLINRTTLKDTPNCGDWRQALTLGLSPEPDGKSTKAKSHRKPWTIDVSGPYSKACAEKDWPLLWTGDDELDYADRLLTAIWQEQGGHHSGGVVDGTWPADLPAWLSWESPPLATIVTEINKFSNNVMARQLFLTLGADTLPATLEQARQKIGAHVANQTREADGHSACDAQMLVLDNGSGLSRTERTTANCLGQWLRAIWASPVMPELLASLPVAGVDGTARRLNSVAGKVHLKTGSLDGVAALAGVAEGDSGQRYVVVGIVNAQQTESARPFLETVLGWTIKDRNHD